MEDDAILLVGKFRKWKKTSVRAYMILDWNIKEYIKKQILKNTEVSNTD